MNSISASENVLEVENVGLAFQVRRYRERSLRDIFVGTFRDPLGAILRSKSVIPALRDLNLTIRRGERVALIGLNGAGKTSLCRAITGIIRPQIGRITVHGSVRAVLNAQVAVLGELTGRENARLLVSLFYREANRAERAAILDDALTFSELGPLLDAPYETYSQGMKARLCLSVATARPSDLLILDEVYDSSDQFFQGKMAARVNELIHRSGAVLFVSHSPDAIRRICNRAVLLQDTRLAYDGEVEHALRAYGFLNRP